MQTKMQTKPNRPVVVAALDLAVRTEEILNAAARLAAAGGELHVVHVMSQEAAGGSRDNAALHFVTLTDRVRAKLDAYAAELPKTISKVFLHIRIGAADVEIVQVASDVSADVVVVGTRDHTGVERIIFGSVGASLIRYAPCPVLVCRPKTVAQWEQILPPCPDCLAVQESSGRKSFWCERHSQHHPRAHTYSEFPATYGVGAQTFR